MGGYPIVREGYVFIMAGLFLSLLLFIAFGKYAMLPPMVLTCYFAYFFRNPHRNIPNNPDLITSPADGTVQDVVELDDDDFLHEPCVKVIIFLSVFNVHVNRSPIAGEIKNQRYVCGRFIPAYKDDVGFENERHLLGIENDRIKVTVTQIAGILARRIVSWVTVDDKMDKGQVYGLIKFGSCTELVMPKRSVEVYVKKGDKVRGGESVLAKIKD